MLRPVEGSATELVEPSKLRAAVSGGRTAGVAVLVRVPLKVPVPVLVDVLAMAVPVSVSRQSPTMLAWLEVPTLFMAELT